MAVVAPDSCPASTRRRESSLAALDGPVRTIGALPVRDESWPRRADWSRRWLRLFVGCRAGTALVAGGLLALPPFSDQDPALAALAFTWTAWTILAVRLAPGLGGRPLAWCVDGAVTLGLVLAAGEWRSPFYLLAVSSLILPATSLPPRRARAAALLFAGAYLGVALITGIDWETLASTARLESFTTHLVIPGLVVLSLAYASELLKDLEAERRHSEALALEAERRRIGWELHGSAKQRIHAANLVLTSLAAGDVTPEQEPRLRIALDELGQAIHDIDASLTELRTSLGGQRLEEALARRAAELHAASGIVIEVHGSTPEPPTFVAVHAYRVICEAMVNAARHATPTSITVNLGSEAGWLHVAVIDDGRGLPPDAATGATTGLRSMEARARTLGGTIERQSRPGGGTTIELDAPLLGVLRPGARAPS